MTCFNLETNGDCNIFSYDESCEGCNSDGQCCVEGETVEECYEQCDCFEQDGE